MVKSELMKLFELGFMGLGDWWDCLNLDLWDGWDGLDFGVVNCLNYDFCD